MTADLEHRVAERVADLAARSGEGDGPFAGSWWTERMMGWAMSHPSFRTQLFRFIDVFPATAGDDDVLEHLDEYLHAGDSPRLLDLAVDLAEHLPGGKAVAASLARRNVSEVASRFIVGSGPREALEALGEMWHHGTASTVDLLGEKTVSDGEADAYAQRVLDMIDVLSTAARSWEDNQQLAADDIGPLARVSISLKPTALAPFFEPLNRDRVMAGAGHRLGPILHRACQAGVSVYLDAEHYDTKSLSLAMVRRLLEDEGLDELELGLVIQCYLRDSRDDLADLIAFSATRPRPLTIRLVKGAYWDTETIQAAAAGWPPPVFLDKAHTDANYERCTRLLHDHHGEVRAAFGTHNLRSVAYALEYARQRQIPDNGFEVQVLAGMGEWMRRAVTDAGMRCRVYAPVGELVPGMAYLVRRLLENTANESFLRQRLVERRDLAELTGPPPAADFDRLEDPPKREPTVATEPGPYRPEPWTEWRVLTQRAAFSAAVDRVGSQECPTVAARIGGESVLTPEVLESRDPSDPDHLVARSAVCGTAEADAAVQAASAAWPEWAAWPPARRAQVLFDAAAWMRSRRARIAALQVFEVGKPWPEADADVCEAIDFCEYYGRRALELAVGAEVDSPPGEWNRMSYVPRGVGAVIAPWNFPLAICTGMTVASLVTGNTVVLKPAEQSPVTGEVLVEALEAAGLPAGALGFVPGRGEVVGARLVEHPDVAFVNFTGSREVGLGIVEAAARPVPGARQVRRVVAEMGGKNPIVVDTDADPDDAVAIILASAFGFSGQKCSACSRLIVIGSGYDSLVDRLVRATAALVVGPAREMATRVGPLVDAEALDKVSGYLDLARTQGRVLTAPRALPAKGFFVAPTVVADLEPSSAVLREEIFGPVLAVQRAADLEEAVALANDTPYALTAGILSRSPAHIQWASQHLRAGNLYVNRSITGAVVGRQPFGGRGLSGVGSKAGGPDYLLQFTDGVVVSENTVRRGFAPGVEGAP